MMQQSKASTFMLQLYVTGATPASTRAIANLKMFCDLHLKERYQLEVIDIFQSPTLAKSEGIFITPTLVKLLPGPKRRFVGDLSDLAGKLVEDSFVAKHRSHQD